MDWLFTYADPELDWAYALSTLMVRFIGVFVVMLVMQVAMQASAAAVRWWEDRAVPAPPAPTPAPAASAARQTAGPAVAQGAIDDASVAAAALALSASDDAVVAAIAAALAIEVQPAARVEASVGGPSPWASAGRLQQLNRLPR